MDVLRRAVLVLLKECVARLYGKRETFVGLAEKPGTSVLVEVARAELKRLEEEIAGLEELISELEEEEGSGGESEATCGALC